MSEKKISIEVSHTATEHRQALLRKEYTASELAEACLEQAEKHLELGVFIRYDKADILKQAKHADKRYQNAKSLGPLDGIPVSIKDNISQQGKELSCASRILKNYIAPYDATVIKKLKQEGAVLFGQSNMDEFAMGSSTENSSFQKTCNPWQKDSVPGGSSGGAAAGVAACITPLALGSDTGGSIRQPASFCGVIGLRPSYGRVSRYGLVAFASSLDQIGPLGRSVADCAVLADAINGHDPLDSTSNPRADSEPINNSIPKLEHKDWEGLKVGVLLPKNANMQAEVSEAIDKAKNFFIAKKAHVIPLESKLEEYLIPIYYILSTAEASSNLGRYDGVRYGHRNNKVKNLKELYIRSRTEGFGKEVRRRILLGTFVLSSGYHDAYYKKAQQAAQLVKNEISDLFKKVSIIIGPTSTHTAFKFGERKDPLTMYQSDLCTIPAALASLPSISVPAGLDKRSLPIGIQFTSPAFSDMQLLKVAAAFQEGNSQFNLDYRSFTR